MAVLNKKVAGFGLVDLATIAAAKFGGEMLFSRVVGNSTLKSGLAKLAVAVVATKANRNVAVGVALDGAEDILIASGVRNMIAGSLGGSNEGGF